MYLQRAMCGTNMKYWGLIPPQKKFPPSLMINCLSTGSEPPLSTRFFLRMCRGGFFSLICWVSHVVMQCYIYCWEGAHSASLRMEGTPNACILLATPLSPSEWWGALWPGRWRHYHLAGNSGEGHSRRVFFFSVRSWSNKYLSLPQYVISNVV